MSALTSAIDEFAGADLDAFPDAAFGRGPGRSASADRPARAHWLRRLAALDARGGAAADGAVSTAAWLRGTCRLGERVVVARELAELPATAAELGGR